MSQATRVMLDFVGEDSVRVSLAAQYMADRIMDILATEGVNTDDDNFSFRLVRTTIPLIIPDIEDPIVSLYPLPE
jgi:hypothetical protein